MPSVKENLHFIQQQISDTALACGRNPETVQLIGVTKKKEVSVVQAAIDAGAVHLGENYIQEAMDKIDTIGRDAACWHFIGHLQSNKARFAVAYFEYIHTVDTVKLATEINKQARKIDKVQKIFLQVNIGDEASKSGTRKEAAAALADEISRLENISLQGLMCMPPYFDDPELARPYFQELFQIRKKIQADHPGLNLKHLSMGMSNDFRVAIQEGATLVRVGTAIFGSRN